MKRKDGVTVIVPCYNVEKYLDKCVESLIDQTIDNYEILLIDDGSTDKTPEMVDAFVKKYPKKIKGFHKKNGGLCDARNYGIEKATMKYLMFVDSDDWVKENFVELPYLKAKEGYDIVSFDAIEIYDGANNGYHRSNFEGVNQEKETFVLYSTNPSFAWARLYDYKLFEKVKYPEPNIWYEDIATTPILISYAKNICHISEELYYYRQREGSISHRTRDSRVLGVIEACERSLKLCNKKYLPEVEFAIYHTVCDFVYFCPEFAEDFLEFIKTKRAKFEKNQYIMDKINNGKFENLFDKKLIPKKIHYFWFGGNPLNELTLKCIESWKKFAPDYEIIEWNETNCDIHCNQYVEEAYKAKKWAFVADFFRIQKLYEEGGLYVDTDMEFTKPIDSLRLDQVFFPIEKDSINACVFGCVAHHPFIKLWLESYKDAHFIREDGSYDMDTTIVVRLTNLMKSELNLKHKNVSRNIGMGIKLYTPDVLLIDVFNNQNIMLHHYDATWWDVRFNMRSYKYEVMEWYFKHLPKQKEPLLFRIKKFIFDSCRWFLNLILPKSLYKKLKKIYRKIKPAGGE